MERSVLVGWLESLPVTTPQQSTRLNPRHVLTSNFLHYYELSMPTFASKGISGILFWAAERDNPSRTIGKYGMMITSHLVTLSPLVQSHVRGAGHLVTACQWYPRLDKSVEAALARFTLEGEKKRVEEYRSISYHL